MSVSYHYESVGNSSYLVATVAQGQGIVNFELQMLTNNAIKNLLPVSRRQKNDDICLLYNVTSKMSLAQVVSKKKISKAGFIQLLNGALNAVEEAGEYQLTSSGFIFSPEYIFLSPGSFEPSFMYLPTAVEERGIEPLKRFLMDLIFKSMVEETNDNFVQVVLDTVNNPALSIETLRALCGKYSKSNGTKPVVPGGGTMPKDEVTQRGGTVPGDIPLYGVGAMSGGGAVPGSGPVYDGGAMSGGRPVNGDGPMPGGGAVPGSGPVYGGGLAPGGRAVPGGGSVSGGGMIYGGGDVKKKGLTPKHIIFIAMQAVFAVAIVALILSGVLKNADGHLNIQYVAGILIAVAAVDFIVYREMFINSKSGKKAGNEKAPVQDKNAGRSITQPYAQPDLPHRPAAQPMPVMPPTPNVPSAPQAEERRPPAQNYRVAEVKAAQSDEDSDKTVIDDNPEGPYLEYFENGLSTRFMLDKDSSVVGRMKSQCDFTLANSKISKVHAEFIRRDGEYFVKDYNSANGTYINGSSQRIAANTEYPIHNGDKISLANSELIFRC